MNKYMKYSLLVMLAFAMTIGLVFAQSVPIGQSLQDQPYESNPTNWARSPSTLPVTNALGMYDGDLLTSGNVKTFTTTTSTPAFATFDLIAFTNTPATAFAIAWVDFKMKYTIPAFTDDKIRIEYAVGASAWTVISPEAAGAATKFNRDGVASIRPWTNLVEPNDGAWDWTDIASLKIRFYMTKMGTYWDGKTFYISEAWLTIYAAAPPAASTTVSLQPSSILGVGPGQYVFVDIYVRDVASLWGFQFTIHYDTNVLTADQYFAYWLFDTAAPSWIDDTIGEVSVSYTSYDGDLTGFTGNTPMARIYFAVDAGGSTALSVDLSILSDPFGNPIAHNLYHGWVSSNIIMSTQPPMVLPPGPPLMGSQWHELYPTYSRIYTLTSWLDNTDGILSASDQIDMLDQYGKTHWYHVDQVTITIHWTFKPPAVGEGKAEPEVPREMPPAMNSRWHQIYPVWSRWFTIKSHVDTDADGYLDPSEQFDFEYDDELGVIYEAHLDAVSTDIILSEKPPPIPEFPLGLGMLMLIAPAIPIVYLWRTHPRRKVT